MNTKHTKNDYINEILRLCRTLTQLKYDSDDDRVIKGLIAENLVNLGRIEARKYELKQMRQEARQQKKYGLIPLVED